MCGIWQHIYIGLIYIITLIGLPCLILCLCIFLGTIKFDSFDGTKDSSSDDGYDSPRGGGGKHGGRSSDDYDSTYEPKSTDNVVNRPGRNGRGGGRGHRGGRGGSSGHGH